MFNWFKYVLKTESRHNKNKKKFIYTFGIKDVFFFCEYNKKKAFNVLIIKKKHLKNVIYLEEDTEVISFFSQF